MEAAFEDKTGKVLSFMDSRERDRSEDRVREVFNQRWAEMGQKGACQSDSGGDGQGRYLLLEGVRCAMADLNVACEDVEQLFDEMDKNKDDKVDFEEFFEVATKARGVDCWARKLEVWRSLGDGLLFFTGEANDALRRIGELKEEEISVICEAMAEKMKHELTREVLKVKESVAAMDAKLARDEAKGGAKFQTFEADMGSIEDFRKGLGNRVGHPQPKLEEAMKVEHSVKDGCDVEIETRNYGIRTTPRKEWEYLMVDASKCPPKDRHHGRRVRMLSEVLEDEEVKAIVEIARLLDAEVGATVLYTGPLYELYNACLRQLRRDLIYQELSRSKNLFPTTIFLLASAVLKISRVMKLGEGLKVYRGLGGQMKLPETMVREDSYGRRGAAEWGFISTTSNKSIAVSYSGVREGKPAASVLVAEVSAIDRGACIRAFSQYPQEIEFLYPPLSFIELSGEEYYEATEEGPVRMIPVRISVNQKTMTSEEVVGQKKELHVRAFENLVEEARRELLAKEAKFGPRFQKDIYSRDPKYRWYTWSLFVEKTVQECLKVLERHRGKVDAEEYNEEERYEGLVREMLLTKRMAISKARLYLEDVSKGIQLCDDENLRSLHRLWMARLRRMASEDVDEVTRKGAALELCKAKGLVVRSVEEENESGESRMLEAARDGWRREDVELLCVLGGDVNMRDGDGTRRTPVIAAAWNGHMETLTALLEKGGDVHAVDNYGSNALMFAAEEGHVEAVKMLLEKGADVNAVNTFGRIALSFAAGRGHVEAVKVLLEKGADVNAVEKDVKTALMWAADRGHLEVVKVLLENGAAVNAVDKNGWTALMFASRYGHVEAVKVLKEANIGHVDQW